MAIEWDMLVEGGGGRGEKRFVLCGYEKRRGLRSFCGFW
jgi:hypothetical protein